MADGKQHNPVELGMLCGHDWATRAGLMQIAEIEKTAVVPDVVRELCRQAGLTARLAMFDDVDAAEAEFWSSFVDGVRAFVLCDLEEASRLN